MASDLFVFDSSLFTDPFSPFSDSSVDILQSFPTPTPFADNYEAPVDELDQMATTLLSSSPPSHQLENLSVSQISQLEIPSNFPNRFLDHSFLEVKTEECQLPSFYSTHDDYTYHDSDSFLPHSYGGTDNAVKMMQRSFTTNCFDGKPNFHFQPRFDSVVESPILSHTTPQAISSPESCFFSGQMRRVFSTGDLQKTKTNQTESTFTEEANSKIGRYSAEERKERIHRYREKRTQRNFNKTIKYECRKTLADNRPRIRGRFARNDELGDPKAATSYYEDDLWSMEGVHGAEDEGMIRVGERVPLFSSSSSSYGTTSHHLFHYYGSMNDYY